MLQKTKKQKNNFGGRKATTTTNRRVLHDIWAPENTWLSVVNALLLEQGAGGLPPASAPPMAPERCAGARRAQEGTEGACAL